MDTAMGMVNAIDSSNPIATTANPAIRPTEENYFLSSVPLANFFGIAPLPREPLALDDYRWDQLMVGVGPETFIVKNCSNLSNYIPTVANLQDRYHYRRLLRHLQGLLVMFQSGVPEQWLKAAEMTKDWIASDWSLDFFEMAETEAGSSHGEGEEEEIDDDPSDGPDDGDETDDAGQGGQVAVSPSASTVSATSRAAGAAASSAAEPSSSAAGPAAGRRRRPSSSSGLRQSQAAEWLDRGQM